MPEDSPVLATLTEMTAVSISRSNLGARDHVMARIAALVAVGAPAGSYLLHIGSAADAGITLEDVQGVLIAVAPIVGTPRIAAAAAHIAKALGIAIELAEAGLDVEAD
jgi:alkylhydroperoxidase/carboxymuconolactone decarboxylase family protein YurZ